MLRLLSLSHGMVEGFFALRFFYFSLCYRLWSSRRASRPLAGTPLADVTPMGPLDPPGSPLSAFTLQARSWGPSSQSLPIPALWDPPSPCSPPTSPHSLASRALYRASFGAFQAPSVTIPIRSGLAQGAKPPEGSPGRKQPRQGSASGRFLRASGLGVLGDRFRTPSPARIVDRQRSKDLHFFSGVLRQGVKTAPGGARTLGVSRRHAPEDFNDPLEAGSVASAPRRGPPAKTVSEATFLARMRIEKRRILGSADSKALQLLADV